MKHVLFDFMTLYRTANGNIKFKRDTTTKFPARTNPEHSQHKPPVASLLNDHQSDMKETEKVTVPTTVSIENAIQPAHYIAALIHQTLLQLMEVEQIKAHVGMEFEKRAQSVRSERQMQELQGEFQQFAQQIKAKEQEVQNSMYSQDEVDTMTLIIQHGLENDDVYNLMLQMGMEQGPPVDENGLPIDPNQPPQQQQQPPQKGGKGKSQKKPVGPTEHEQAELVLKTVMESRVAKPSSSGWLSSLFKSTLAVTGVAGVASAAYLAYQYWNGSWGKGESGMISDKTNDNSPPPPRGDSNSLLPNRDDNSDNHTIDDYQPRLEAEAIVRQEAVTAPTATLSPSTKAKPFKLTF